MEEKPNKNQCLADKDFDILLEVLNSYFVATFQTIQNIESMPQTKNLFGELISQEDIDKTVGKLLQEKRAKLTELDQVKAKLYFLRELMLDQKGELSVEDILGNDLKGKG